MAFSPLSFCFLLAGSVDEGEGGRRSWVLEESGTKIKSLRGALGSGKCMDGWTKGRMKARGPSYG